ncbi:glycosyltransferase [Paenibacillus sp. FSL R7-0163]|uniref:glycosyltransferase n=1 Tax=Paenibacillus sp. FSL R7-0163 TaxID=2954530 RepID=UPI0030DCB27A
MKYSVLISVYCKENPEYLKLSIQSMVDQTLKPDEIVIVKDGKLTDELDNIINEFLLINSCLFTIVTLKKNVGLGLALNEGLNACRNELVARMDSDDISLENRCELQCKEFEKNQRLSIVGTMTDEFFEEPNNVVTSRIVPTEHSEILKFSRRRSPFNHPTVMYKKSEVIGCGGYHDVKRKEDIDLFARMLNQGCIAMNIDKALLLFRSNEDNFKRRKSWENCVSYINVIYNFWKKGYSRIDDLLFVTIGQVVMFLAPIWLLKLLSNSFLRKRKI